MTKSATSEITVAIVTNPPKSEKSGKSEKPKKEAKLKHTGNAKIVSSKKAK